MTDAQLLVIKDWLPAPLTNGSRGHWSTHQKKLKAAQIMVWAAGKQAGLVPLVGRARVTVELVFSVKRRRDADNAVARCKGIFDGLVKGGWLVDDSTEWLEPVVRCVVEPGNKETRITLVGME